MCIRDSRYASENAVLENPDEGDLAAELVTGADGTAVSEPLETGWYLLRETKAPDTYAIMQRDTRVQITSNHTEALQIENAQRGALQIIKYGQLTLGSVATESRVPLAGAVFGDRKSTRLNSSHSRASRMPSSA